MCAYCGRSRGALDVCVAMGGGWSFAFTLIPRTGLQGHTNSFTGTHMGCLVDCEGPSALWLSVLSKPLLLQYSSILAAIRHAGSGYVDGEGLWVRLVCTHQPACGMLCSCTTVFMPSDVDCWRLVPAVAGGSALEPVSNVAWHVPGYPRFPALRTHRATSVAIARYVLSCFFGAAI
jgi:hypothetical protein